MRLISLLLLLASLAPVRPAVAIEDVPAGIERLLDDRGEAWEQRDRKRFEELLVPGKFASAQLKSFDNASDLKFADVTFTAITQYSGNLAGKRVKDAYPAMEVAAYQIAEQTSISGVESEPFIEGSVATFVRKSREGRNDGWLLASESDFEVLGALAPRRLWDDAPVRIKSGANFTVLAHPDQIEGADTISTQAEAAYQAAKKFWPRPVSSKYVIVVPSTSTELAAMLQSTVDLQKFVAFAVGTSFPGDEFKPAGVRIFLQASHFNRYSAEGKRSVLTHELIHAITRPVSGPFMPTWVEEGLAQHGSEEGSAVAKSRGRPEPVAFPNEEDFFVGSSAEIVKNYSRSQVAFEILEVRSGRESIAKFYETLGRIRLAPGTTDAQVRKAVAESIGWSLDEWTASWRERL